jgi:hypothetical protein
MRLLGHWTPIGKGVLQVCKRMDNVVSLPSGLHWMGLALGSFGTPHITALTSGESSLRPDSTQVIWL